MGSLTIRSEQTESHDHRDRIIASLEEENRDLQEQVAAARREMESQRSDTLRAVAELRKQLSPLYRALQMVFGEIDAVMPDDESVPSHKPGNKSEVWEAWKRKLGGKAAEFISELQIHGEMTGQQLKVATRCGQRTVYGAIATLNKAQLINKNGSKYSLKEL